MNIYEFTSIYTQISTSIQTGGLIAGMKTLHEIFPNLTIRERHAFAKSEVFESALNQFQENRRLEFLRIENSPEARDWYKQGILNYLDPQTLESSLKINSLK